MNSNDLTFEQVDQQLQNVDLSQFQEGGKSFFTAASTAESPASVLPMICNAYRTIRPILLWIVKILPKRWADIVNTFIRLMDTLCPG